MEFKIEISVLIQIPLSVIVIPKLIKMKPLGTWACYLNLLKVSFPTCIMKITPNIIYTRVMKITWNNMCKVPHTVPGVVLGVW